MEGADSKPDTAAGWYTDPADPTQARWWDGDNWTAHSRPGWEIAPPPGSNIASVDRTPPVEEVTLDAGLDRNWMASLSLTIGTVSLLINPLLLASFASIVLGALGRQQAMRYLAQGRLPIGLRESNWGIGLGLVGVVTGLWIMSQAF